MDVAAEAAAELDENVESLLLVVDVAGALTADKRERTEEALAELLEFSEELVGGEPGGVVLKGMSRLDRVLFSVLTEGNDGFGRPESSTSLG